MPYKRSQCRAFGAKDSRGESVPSDWKKHCRKKSSKRRGSVRRKK